MGYIGKSRRLAKEIAKKVLIPNLTNSEQTIIDGNLGGCSMPPELINLGFKGKIIGLELNEYVVACHEAIRRGWVPDYVPVEEWDAMKAVLQIDNHTRLYPPHVMGWAMVYCCFNGQWANSYCYRHDRIHSRLVQAKEYRALKNRVLPCKQVEILNQDLFKYAYPENTLCYFDPPYDVDRNDYYAQKGFDHPKFWEFIRGLEKQGIPCFVSEYKAPSDFKTVFAKEVSWLNKKHLIREYRTEKVFRLNS